jgi:hypothetical protein
LVALGLGRGLNLTLPTAKLFGFNYRSRSGLFYVDFNDPDKIRIPKNSTGLVKNITSTRRVPSKYVYYEKELNKLEFDEASSEEAS